MACTLWPQAVASHRLYRQGPELQRGDMQRTPLGWVCADLGGVFGDEDSEELEHKVAVLGGRDEGQDGVVAPPLAEDALVLGGPREEPQEAVPRQGERLLALKEVGPRRVLARAVPVPALKGAGVAPVANTRHAGARSRRGSP